MPISTEPEPWLRGPLSEIPPHVTPAFFSFQQVREDLAKHTAGITPEQLWRNLTGLHTLGFHLNHIAGSVERLITYLSGNQLTAAQLKFLQNEHTAAASLDDLLLQIDRVLRLAEDYLLKIKVESLFESRVVGRNLLPTTVLGLMVHICEHTQRHLGQAILLAKILRRD